MQIFQYIFLARGCFAATSVLLRRQRAKAVSHCDCRLYLFSGPLRLRRRRRHRMFYSLLLVLLASSNELVLRTAAADFIFKEPSPPPPKARTFFSGGEENGEVRLGSYPKVIISLKEDQVKYPLWNDTISGYDPSLGGKTSYASMLYR